MLLLKLWDVGIIIMNHCTVIPSPSSISYTLNGTVVDTVSIPVLQEFELVANSETDFYLYDVTTSFPQFISIDPRTGLIHGFAASRLPQTKVTVSGQSVTSVVLTELTFEFYIPENGTVVSGEVWGSQGLIKVLSGSK